MLQYCYPLDDHDLKIGAFHNFVSLFCDVFNTRLVGVDKVRHLSFSLQSDSDLKPFYRTCHTERVIIVSPSYFLGKCPLPNT